MTVEQDEALEEHLFAALREHNASLLGTLLGTLILTDADINAPNESGQTALEAAFEWECPDEMRLMLIDSGADVAAVRDQIAWALRTGSANVLKLFVEAGADINAAGSDGTPLEVAVEDGDGACALALLAAGASLERADCSRPLLGVAAYKGMEEVVKALLDAGAQANCPFTFPDSHGVLDELSSVFDSMFGDPSDDEAKRRSELPTTCYADATPLIVAAGEGHAGIVRLLLERGADVEATDSDGLTALDVAQRRGQTATVIALLDGGAHPQRKPASPRKTRPTGKAAKKKPRRKAASKKKAAKSGTRKKSSKKKVKKVSKKTAGRKTARKKVNSKKASRKKSAAKKTGRKPPRKKSKTKTAKKRARKKLVVKNASKKKRRTR